MGESRDPEQKNRPAPEGAEDVVLVDAPSESLEEILAEQRAESEKEHRALGSAAAALAAAERELAEMRDRLVRKVAEFENFKKRTEREKADYYKFALADVVRDLLPVLDNFERAIASPAGTSAGDLRQGIELISRQLLEALRRHGLSEVAGEGVFDPNVHEAVAREETSEAPPGTILEVLQKGYFLSGKLLRPAFVKVAVAPDGEGRGGAA